MHRKMAKSDLISGDYIRPGPDMVAGYENLAGFRPGPDMIYQIRRMGVWVIDTTYISKFNLQTIVYSVWSAE